MTPTAAASATPAARATPAPTPASTTGGGEGKVYVVEEGDTLAIIAEKQYGDASLWQRIYEANKDVIGDNPDAIQVGMRLTIPPRS